MTQSEVKVTEHKGSLNLQLPSSYSQIHYGKRQKYIAFGAKASTDNYAEAYRAAARLEEDLEKGTFHPDNEVQYKHFSKRIRKGHQVKSKQLIELFDLWVDKTKKKGKISGNREMSESGEIWYKGEVRRHFEQLPQDYLTKKSQEDIAEYLEEQFANRTRSRYLGILYNLLDWAISEESVPQNTPNHFKELEKGVGKPKKRGCPKILEGKETFRDPEKIAWNKEERDLIISAIKNRGIRKAYYKECDVLGLLIEFLFHTGTRHGEAFALTWDRIRESEKGVQCVINRSYNSNYRITKETKTGKERTIWLTKRASGIIGELRKFYESQERKCNGNNLVFQKENGNGFNTSDIHRSWCYHSSSKAPVGVVKLVAEGKLDQYLDAYSTRRTFISLQAQSGGMDSMTVASYIGDNVETIYKHYYQSQRIDGAIPAQDI